ncbi:MULTISPECIES: hypothetical protein [unclassified Gordonia (in: high G+C Gram-positive bacteria)]|uniref:hypothetical protein n=1 Tax=unclassified Gordonia (in: high G+C Gram-positive bacteria) TaxID=2657482 RepID=UPI001F10233D|nr:hypothetical protein [Gordonia sp. ABSL49_1]MCH5644512.1 hypothetical protein [Gordonia sp. ABSL49_1]
MTSIQVADATFVAAAPALVADVIADRARWRRWWPDLSLTVTEDRGAQGVRWTVDGPLRGTMEVWCEAVLDGFVLHYFLHAEPAGSLGDRIAGSAADLAQENKQRRVAGKVMSFAVKDDLESGRIVGGPAVGVQASGLDASGVGTH